MPEACDHNAEPWVKRALHLSQKLNKDQNFQSILNSLHLCTDMYQSYFLYPGNRLELAKKEHLLQIAKEFHNLMVTVELMYSTVEGMKVPNGSNTAKHMESSARSKFRPILSRPSFP